MSVQGINYVIRGVCQRADHNQFLCKNGHLWSEAGSWCLFAAAHSEMVSAIFLMRQYNATTFGMTNVKCKWTEKIVFCCWWSFKICKKSYRKHLALYQPQFSYPISTDYDTLDLSLLWRHVLLFLTVHLGLDYYSGILRNLFDCI